MGLHHILLLLHCNKQEIVITQPIHEGLSLPACWIQMIFSTGTRTRYQDEIQPNFGVIERLLSNFIVCRLLDIPIRRGETLVVGPVAEQNHLHLAAAAVGKVARDVALLAGIERVPEDARGAHLVRHAQEDG